MALCDTASGGVTKAAKHISSDGDKAEVLIEMASSYQDNGGLGMAYFEAVKSISSDGDHAHVLLTLLSAHGDDRDTLDRLLGADPKLPVDQHVNGIPGYSSFWFTGVADFYRHTGDKAFLEREHQRMLQLLRLVDSEFDNRNIDVGACGSRNARIASASASSNPRIVTLRS